MLRLKTNSAGLANWSLLTSLLYRTGPSCNQQNSLVLFLPWMMDNFICVPDSMIFPFVQKEQSSGNLSLITHIMTDQNHGLARPGCISDWFSLLRPTRGPRLRSARLVKNIWLHSQSLLLTLPAAFWPLRQMSRIVIFSVWQANLANFSWAIRIASGLTV